MANFLAKTVTISFGRVMGWLPDLCVTRSDLDRVLDQFFEEAFQRKPRKNEQAGFKAYVEDDIEQWLEQNTKAYLEQVEPSLNIIYSMDPKKDEAIRKAKRVAKFRKEMK